MYFPYLRGKQEELLALQELLSSNRLSNNVIPIIEPVKLSPTLINTLQLFVDKKRKIYIVQNPAVGNFDDDLNTNIIGDEDEKEKRKIEILIENQNKYKHFLKNKYFEYAFLFSNDEVDSLREISQENKIILLFDDDDQIEDYLNCNLNKENINMLFVPEIGFEDELDTQWVLFRDRFKKAARNSDYLDNIDEFFSKDHIICFKNGYTGFSDYSIVGKGYDIAGFSPRAIAIHIVYLNSETSAIRIRHFVSDTNHNTKNPALKFSEAMAKLITWLKENDIQTLGIDKLVSYYQNEKHPGLGSIKRFSIMHHLELVGNYLDNK